MCACHLPAATSYAPAGKGASTWAALEGGNLHSPVLMRMRGSEGTAEAWCRRHQPPGPAERTWWRAYSLPLRPALLTGAQALPPDYGWTEEPPALTALGTARPHAWVEPLPFYTGSTRGPPAAVLPPGLVHPTFILTCHSTRR